MALFGVVVGVVAGVGAAAYAHYDATTKLERALALERVKGELKAWKAEQVKLEVDNWTGLLEQKKTMVVSV